MSFAGEDLLLIQCSRMEMRGEAIVTASKLLRQVLNWDYILEVSIRHGVSPLLYCGLNQVAQVVELDKLVPAPIMKKLQKLYRGNQSRNQRLYRVILDIFKAFGQASIQAMGLKDVQLAREVYPDIGLRPMGDIDILIHLADYSKVATCMANLGFTPLPDRDIPFTLKYAWGHHFHRPADNVWVDVQWNILQREWDVYHEGNFDFQIDGIWGGAKLMTIDDYQILVPKPEDMLFHLCLHLEGHHYCELILFCDIVEFLRYYNEQLDWRYLIDLTRKYGVESSIYYVLFMVKHLFKVSLPPFLFQELQPTYFKANLFTPLFGNLTLHLSLDQIHLSASPPYKTMAEFETAVRRQAVGAMQLYKEIDKIASTFIDLGGNVIILDGTFLEQFIPDLSVSPFEEIYFLILDHDLLRMLETLSICRFTPEYVNDLEICIKQREIASSDPAIVGKPTIMTLRGDITRGLDHLFCSESDNRVSKKDIALRSIKAKLGNHKNDNITILVHVKIIALSPEDMLLFLSAKLGKQKMNRLYGLCSLLEFFRGCSDSLDWQYIASAAQRYDISKLVCEGLLMVGELLDNKHIPPDALNLLTCSDSPPRVLDWARYGPDSLDRYTGFKRTFFYLFSFLATEGVEAKFRYLLRSLFGDQENKPVLPGLMLELVTNIFSWLHRKRYTARDFAYWIEPELTLETEPENNFKV